MAQALFCGTEAESLASHQLFHSFDLEETHAKVAGVFKPHNLKVLGQNQRVDARMAHLKVGKISLNRLCYGADVAIDPDRLGNFVLVQMPISGCADISCGRQSIQSTSSLPSVITPTLPLKMRWKADCDQFIVRVERETLERACSAHVGHDLPRPIEFELGMNLEREQTYNWQKLITFLTSDIGFAQNAAQFPLLAAQIERLVICTLLTCQPHNYREELLSPVPAPAPYYVRRAEEYMNTHADEPITMEDLVSAAGVSTRSLFAGFSHFRGTTPMAYLREIRLRRVHEELSQACPSQTVTAVAMKWGFTHLGHFTAAYRKKFGKLPSETLRR